MCIRDSISHHRGLYHNTISIGGVAIARSAVHDLGFQLGFIDTENANANYYERHVLTSTASVYAPGVFPHH